MKPRRIPFLGFTLLLASISLWPGRSRAAPLSAQPFVLIAEPAKAYGAYLPRRDNVFPRDEEMHFYLEPKNLVYPKTGQGLYKPAFSVDFQILDAAGNVVAKRERFGFFQFSSKSPLQDIYANLNLEFTGAPAGSYQVRFVLRDTNSPKTATVTQSITLK